VCACLHACICVCCACVFVFARVCVCVLAFVKIETLNRPMKCDIEDPGSCTEIS